MSEEFNDDELETLRKGVMGAGLLVSVSDRGFFDTFKEASALAKHVTEARRNSDSALVRTIAEGRPGGFGVTTPPAEIESRALDALRSSIELLAAREPDEVESYRSFVRDVARSVAAAAGGGDEVEAGAIAKVEAALQGDGAPPAAAG